MNFFKKILPKKLDQLVYVVHRETPLKTVAIQFDETASKIEVDDQETVMRHKLLINDEVAYKSNTHKKVHFLKTIGKYQYPVIGDCYTYEKFRGKSIYPYMLQKASITALKTHDTVFILVSPENLASIRGIEKSGAVLHSRITTIRFGVFYLFKKIS